MPILSEVIVLGMHKVAHSMITRTIGGGCNFNAKDRRGYTPLMVSAQYGRDLCLLTLIHASKRLDDTLHK